MNDLQPSSRASLLALYTFTVPLLVFPLFAGALRAEDLPAELKLRRRAVAPPSSVEKPLTSAGRIRDALRKGTIDDQTALQYQVFAILQDPRLPQQYRGDDSSIEDSLVMADVRERIDTLRPDIRSTLAPFLIPPVYTNSGQESGVTAKGNPPVCSVIDNIHWTYLDTQNGAVRIWWKRARAADGKHAEQMRGWIDTDIWSKLVALFNGRVPVSDQNHSCNGSDGKLDIYLTDSGKAVATPYADCGPSAVFITAGVANGLIGPQTLAHEIAHAFQFAYDLETCLQRTEHRWWAEATGQWVMHHVYPDRNGEHHAAPHLLGHPEESLDLFNDEHEYGAYLYALFLERKLGAGVITQSWENSAAQDAVAAIESATKAHGGFEKLWPEFVLENWNREGVDGYKWDSLTHAAKAATDSTAFSSVDGYKVLETNLPRLSAKYHRFTFPSSARSAAFFNGLNFRLTREQQTWNNIDFGLQYRVTDAPPNKGASLQVLVKRRGSWIKAASWLNEKWKAFCLQESEDSMQEIVFIIANSSTDPARDLKAPALEPLFITTNFGCRWDGHYTFKAIEPLTLAVGNFEIVYQFERRAVADPEREFIGGFFYDTTPKASWKTSGNVGGCPISGSGTVTPLNYVQMSFNFSPTSSTTYRKAYFPTQVPPGSMSATMSCPGGSQSVALPWGNYFPAGEDWQLKIPATVGGDVIKGELPDSPFGIWTWEFKSGQ